jgi:Rieske Fe-S protein
LDNRHSLRRKLLKGAAGIVAALPFLKLQQAAAATDDPKKMRPQEGDHFVHYKGKRKGEIVRLKDLPLGGPQVVAWPVTPDGEIVRRGSRLNQVMLIRLAPESIDEDTQPFAADGVLAYSSVCAHQGCPVSAWLPDKQWFACTCHDSQYDPAAKAKVVNGPAPRRLAILPMRLDNDVPTAAGEFDGRVGVKR